MKKTNWKDVLVRAGKTFVEGFIGSLAVNLIVLQEAIAGEGNIETVVVSLAIGAIAAGVSAAWNGVLEPLFSLGEGEE